MTFLNKQLTAKTEMIKNVKNY